MQGPAGSTDVLYCLRSFFRPESITESEPTLSFIFEETSEAFVEISEISPVMFTICSEAAYAAIDLSLVILAFPLMCSIFLKMSPIILLILVDCLSIALKESLTESNSLTLSLNTSTLSLIQLPTSSLLLTILSSISLILTILSEVF